MRTVNIAIDGPAGTGKSTVAKTLAKQLGYVYLSAGFLYRAITLICLLHNQDVNNHEQIVKFMADKNLSLVMVDGEQQLFINDVKISSDILQREDISNLTPIIAKYPEIRSKVVDVQIQLATTHNVVMEGRDIGTVVLPTAQFKFFLTATADERALRRWRQLVFSGETVDYMEILNDIKARDYQDQNRSISPLKPAKDALRIVTDNKMPNQVVQGLFCTVQKKVGNFVNITELTR